MRTLFLLMLSLPVVISCGSDGDRDGNSPVVSTTPENANTEEETGTHRKIRYSSILLEENCGFWTDCDFTVRSDFNQRPVTLTADFHDNRADIGQCQFEVTLTEGEAGELFALADKLKICRGQNTPRGGDGFDGIFTTDLSGKEYMAYKFKTGGQVEDGAINYLCAGRSAFYNYMGKLLIPKAPAECPSEYKRLFR